MIVPMKRLILLCVADDSANTLEALRDLGAVHLELSQGGGGLTGTAKETLPSSATGTVPRIRLLLKSSHAMPGACVPLPCQSGFVQNRFSGDSTTRRYLTAPGFTSCIPKPS